MKPPDNAKAALQGGPATKRSEESNNFPLTVKGVRGGLRAWIKFALRLLKSAKADPRQLHHLEIWLRAIGKALP